MSWHTQKYIATAMTAWQQQLLHNGKIRKLLFRKKYILLIHFVYIFFHEIVLENTVV